MTFRDGAIWDPDHLIQRAEDCGLGAPRHYHLQPGQVTGELQRLRLLCLNCKFSARLTSLSDLIPRKIHFWVAGQKCRLFYGF